MVTAHLGLVFVRTIKAAIENRNAHSRSRRLSRCHAVCRSGTQIDRERPRTHSKRSMYIILLYTMRIEYKEETTIILSCIYCYSLFCLSIQCSSRPILPC